MLKKMKEIYPEGQR